MDYCDGYYDEVMHTFPAGMFCVYSFKDLLAFLAVPQCAPPFVHLIISSFIFNCQANRVTPHFVTM